MPKLGISKKHLQPSESKADHSEGVQDHGSNEAGRQRPGTCENVSEHLPAINPRTAS